MSDKITYDQKEIEVGGVTYLLQAMGAEYGLTVMDELIENGGMLSTKRKVDILKKSLTYKNKLFDDRTFNVHFSRRYEDIGKIFAEIISFNFPFFGEGEGEAPLEQTADQYQDGTAEE